MAGLNDPDPLWGVVNAAEEGAGVSIRCEVDP